MYGPSSFFLFFMQYLLIIATSVACFDDHSSPLSVSSLKSPLLIRKSSNLLEKIRQTWIIVCISWHFHTCPISVPYFSKKNVHIPSMLLNKKRETVTVYCAGWGMLRYISISLSFSLSHGISGYGKFQTIFLKNRQ